MTHKQFQIIKDVCDGIIVGVTSTPVEPHSIVIAKYSERKQDLEKIPTKKAFPDSSLVEGIVW